jgi:hypothetical protein
VRLAFFHTELSRDGPGILLRDILSGEDAQVGAVARVVQTARPDVIVLAGVDWDLEGHALAALADAIGGFPHRYAGRPNRGLDGGADLDGDGRLGGPGDAVGYGEFSGQEGLAVLSRFPIDRTGLRDFTGFRWRHLPGALVLPEMPADMRLSTTAHWVVPVEMPGGHVLDLLIWHATPPVFDGPEDLNGRRNHDEAAFWLHYLKGAFGAPPEHFVLLGAANLDIFDGEGRPGALKQLIEHPSVRDVEPVSDGAAAASASDGGVNWGQAGDPALDTADWLDEPGWPGNMRVDYVLPSATLRVADAGVFWPVSGASLGSDVQLASRHRLVWLDVIFDTE